VIKVLSEYKYSLYSWPQWIYFFLDLKGSWCLALHRMVHLYAWSSSQKSKEVTDQGELLGMWGCKITTKVTSMTMPNNTYLDKNKTIYTNQWYKVQLKILMAIRLPHPPSQDVHKCQQLCAIWHSLPNMAVGNLAVIWFYIGTFFAPHIIMVLLFL